MRCSRVWSFWLTVCSSIPVASRWNRAPPHLGLRASPRSGLDRSLDRRHLAIAYALNTAFESAAGDRAHDAREVDLNPHLGVGLPIVHRLEFHSPARRGRTHSPGERNVGGRLDSGHFLAPGVSPPQVLRPLLHPRAGLKRPSAANLAFENGGRPLRPAPDIADIRPHLADAAGDGDAALGPECHRAHYVLITFQLHKVSRVGHIGCHGPGQRAVHPGPLDFPAWLSTPSGPGLLSRPRAVSAFPISCVVCSQPRRFDRRLCAAARSRRRWPSSPSQSPIAAARAAGSPAGTSWPGRVPSVLDPSASGSPPTAAAMTGKPWASASVTAMP